MFRRMIDNINLFFINTQLIINNLWSKGELILGFLFGFFVVMVGGMDTQIVALCALTAVDFITGVLASFRLHAFASSIATKGITKKAVMFLVIGLGVLLDSAMGTRNMVRTMFISAYSIIEALSIIENIDKSGWGDIIPVWLRGCLAQVSKRQGIATLENKEEQTKKHGQ